MILFALAEFLTYTFYRLRVCVCACVRVCVCACVRACVRVLIYMHVPSEVPF